MRETTEVSGVDLADLPRVSARAAALLTRAARVAGTLPPRLEVRVGELGILEVAYDGVVPLPSVDSVEAQGDVALGLQRAAGAARLVIDGGLARRLLSAALGVEARPAAPLARLGLAERGVVAGMVAGALAAARAPFSVSLVAPRASVFADGGAAVALTVRAAGAEGWARVELPSDWLSASPPPSSAARELLDVEVSVELARTHLPAPELARASVGDAVVFDGEPALGSGRGARSVRVTLPGLVARARLDQDGTITLEDAPRARVAAARVHANEEDGLERKQGDAARVDERTETVNVAEVLAGLPVEVVAEAGRISLRADEVATLGPGAVLKLGRRGVAPIALRVGEQLWAEGELVDVDGELGVRITATPGRVTG